MELNVKRVRLGVMVQLDGALLMAVAGPTGAVVARSEPWHLGTGSPLRSSQGNLAYVL